MSSKPPDGRTLTTGQIAELFDCAPRTVGKWIDRGRLRGWRLPDGGDRRVEREEVIAFARELGSYHVLRELGALTPGPPTDDPTGPPAVPMALGEAA